MLTPELLPPRTLFDCSGMGAAETKPVTVGENVAVQMSAFRMGKLFIYRATEYKDACHHLIASFFDPRQPFRYGLRDYISSNQVVQSFELAGRV